MQLMQQEQALADIYGGGGSGGGGGGGEQGMYGFGYEEEIPGEDNAGAGTDHWIPADEIVQVHANEGLAEEDATYEQLLELDEQKVVCGLSERLKADRTTLTTLTTEDIARLQPEDLTDRRCAICLCDYEEGEVLRNLPCNHGCHMECMDLHLAQSKNCPMCRTEVTALPL